MPGCGGCRECIPKAPILILLLHLWGCRSRRSSTAGGREELPGAPRAGPREGQSICLSVRPSVPSLCGARRGQQRERTRRGAVAAPGRGLGVLGAEEKNSPNLPVSPFPHPGRSPCQWDFSMVFTLLNPRPKGCELGLCPPEHLFSNHTTDSTNTFLSRHHI